MKHVIVNEPHICPKCLKSNMGSAEAILDLLICPKCAEKYRKDLMPKIEKQVREFFQPERSKREDLLCPSCHSHNIEHVIRAGNFPLVYCHDCKDEVMEEDLIRCGALNSMET